MQKILLHICCGICASSVVERLRKEGYEPIGFFYNPNIQPEEEYRQRQETLKRVAEILKFKLIQPKYTQDIWQEKIKGLENEPEGGARCLVCFRLRLEEARARAAGMKLTKFTTTLTVSPHKNSAAINQIGKAIDPDGFLAFDFKKQDGFKLAIQFAERYNLWRQHYCGCSYSR